MTTIKIPRVLIIVTIVLGVVVVAVGAYTFGVSQRSTSDTAVSNTNNATTNGTTNTPSKINVNSSNGNSNSNANTNTTNSNAGLNTNTPDTTNTSGNINTNTNSADEPVVETDSGTASPIVDEDVAWLAEPELIDDLNVFADSEVAAESDTYYKVADLADGGEIIYVNRVSIGTEVDRFRKTATGDYSLLANHSSEYYLENQDLLAENVEIDRDTTYAALDYPTELTVDGITLEQHWLPFTSNELFGSVNNDPAYPFTELASTAYGTMYIDTEAVETTEADGSIESKSYVLKLADGSVVRYWAKKDFLADDGSLIAEFDDEDAILADQTYFVGMVASGCGVLGGDQYVVDMTAEALDQVGTTSSGDPLYTMRDADSSLLLNAYATYSLGRDGAAGTLLTYEDFVAATPIVLWQDALGDYLLLMDNNFAPLVECGKPVIYLYPENVTSVSVRVGADVRISEPAYRDGWEVTAEPNGTLNLADGSSYENLYWEGKGYGKYPRITSGRVVATKNIKQELRNDLAALGLNATETTDFLEFWLPLMPNTPYVRLSWLDTAAMNQLAPLAVAPRPDTVIRVFLDFAGQNSPETNLQPQTLTAVERTGFTLVEWGGLLLGR